MSSHGFVRKIIGDLSFIDSSPFAKLLDSCLKSKSLQDTRRIHARIIKTQFACEVFIQNRLIDVYGKNGSLDDAGKVFDKMPERNIFSWNAVISIFVKWGFLDEGARLFASMPEPDQISWNSIIAGFAQHDRLEDALFYFVRMHKEGFVLNEYTFGSGLSACSGLKDLRMGTQIHGLMLKSQFLLDVYMGSALVDTYAKCGFVDYAQRVFDSMMDRNIVSWNSLITCYEQNGPAREALDIFVRMMESGFEPDEVTLASVVSACASLAAVKPGLEIHACVVKRDRLRNDLILSNALVDMYAKCGRTNEARCVFDRMQIRNVVSETSMVSGYAKAASVKAARLLFTKMMEKNVVSWNALIAGYTQNGENEEALGLYRMLKIEGIFPTHYTFGNLLNACANLADLQLGRQAHAHVLKHGFQFLISEESDVFVGNALIDMYLKCGSVEAGRQVFENIAERDIVSWNAMIVGYAQNGYGAEALGFFSKMLASGEKPDHITMIGALCACSHAGLVQEGRHYFFSMTEKYGLEPSKDHYTCMVDLLGRAGCLDEAKSLIETMPMQPDAVVWGSLLGACKVHNNINLGEYVAEKLLNIDPTNSGPYVLLSNMYAELGRRKDVVSVRRLMKHRGVVKQPGCSWIEILGNWHVFMVKDKRHPQKEEIYLLLQMLINQMKQTGNVLKDTNGFLEAYEEQSETEVGFFYQMETPVDVAVV
ncbi:pentatricopeptide repeat-containing protein At2g13600 [Mercurialis annua]|uniref:pentatricopeptide repeat-containing protein At2g13600 n=1 Tax=Mercurialis annua TaxID=3986 RepID=UPI00215E149B|nr:pentatricopeptide repeat-containing protein At2g13600 [Mercurialis annua]